MVVDDDESIRLLIGSYFEKDYNVIFMSNGQEALMHIRDVNIPDLVLLDMEMPHMNGRVFLRRIKYSPEHSHIPVIFISSVNSRLIINSMIKLGIVDYIVKPFKPDELIEKVQNVLNGKVDELT
jgi:CheY-like chemotaxis protein